ncbi:NADH dehydrogenase (quinone) subunit G, partial [bacterium]|nr:NADH dehydrogenase (quinone) subunit G [bacterium]
MSLTITIDGQQYEAEQGAMIIEIADRVGVKIPRFCYHPSLSIAANCRMCLVETSNSSRPVPACATPIIDGMVVSTLSQKTQDAQKSVLEFLLINHPLDCPICDQGGECELQDLSLEYGNNQSYYHETKRTVPDLSLGPLIATDMTRCIHCTRCVRFGTEIAGIREMGATGRTEFMRIGTFLESELRSELSGNIIDLCPVGALTSKPNRFIGRSWEFKQKDGLAIHDSCFSSVHWNVLHDQLKRVLPRANDRMNEIWLSDRDRFSYLGLNHLSRLNSPKIKINNQWVTCSWNRAIEEIKYLVQHHQADSITGLYHSIVSMEESKLFNELILRLTGNQKIGYLVNHSDTFSSPLPFTCADLKNQPLLIIGTNFNLEHPILAHHVRQSLFQGNNVFHIGSLDEQMGMQGLKQIVKNPQDFTQTLINILKKDVSPALSDQDQFFKNELISSNQPFNILLSASMRYCFDYDHIIELAHELVALYGGKVGVLSQANAIGCQQQIPDREFFDYQCKLAFTLHLEPEDYAHDQKAREWIENADDLIALTAFEHPSVMQKATIMLPAGLLAENEGHYFNCFGAAEFSNQGVHGLGETKPAWKILAVLIE